MCKSEFGSNYFLLQGIYTDDQFNYQHGGQRVTEVDVYGSYADQPEWVEESLLRWNAHPENLVQEQLAMIPPAAEDHDAAIAAMTGGHAVGAPFRLDIDSIV